jgi:hypothetical protein
VSPHSLHLAGNFLGSTTPPQYVDEPAALPERATRSPVNSQMKEPGWMRSSVLTPHSVLLDLKTSSRCVVPRCVTRLAQLDGHPHRAPHSYTTGIPLTSVPSALYAGPPPPFLFTQAQLHGDDDEEESPPPHAVFV